MQVRSASPAVLCLKFAGPICPSRFHRRPSSTAHETPPHSLRPRKQTPRQDTRLWSLKKSSPFLNRSSSAFLLAFLSPFGPSPFRGPRPHPCSPLLTILPSYIPSIRTRLQALKKKSATEYIRPQGACFLAVGSRRMASLASRTSTGSPPCPSLSPTKAGALTDRLSRILTDVESIYHAVLKQGAFLRSLSASLANCRICRRPTAAPA